MEQAYKMRNNRYRFWYFRGVRRELWRGIVHAMCLWYHNVPVEAPPDERGKHITPRRRTFRSSPLTGWHEEKHQ